MKFGLIGAGAIARTYGDAFAALKSHQLIAVADIDMSRAEAIAAPHRAKVYESATALLTNPDVEAVIIATPPVTHEALACQALASGRHVLCEKPLALTSSSARAMIETAHRMSRALVMATKYRFVEDVARVRRAIADGAIGRLEKVEVVFSAPVDMGNRWNANPAVAGGGVLMDNGTHAFDLIRYLCGPITAIEVRESNRERRYARVEDTVRVSLRLACGARARVDLSWTETVKTPWFLRVRGSGGMLTVGWDRYDKRAAFCAKLNSFAAVARGEAMAAVSDEDALASLEVLEAGYVSLQENRPIALSALTRQELMVS